MRKYDLLKMEIETIKKDLNDLLQKHIKLKRAVFGDNIPIYEG